jgi:hypothetical protein
VAALDKRHKFKIKKSDIYLVVGLLAVAFIFWLILGFFVKKQGQTVVVKVDGAVVYELSMQENTTVTVEGYQGGENVIVIENGAVSMTDADCPDKLCVHSGEKTKTGETIVCLPHRVVVEITGDLDDDGIDAVVQ